jgi:sirohydrochlorin cobaltochelatase
MTQNSKLEKAVLLIGHGGIPSDCPRNLIHEFMTLHKNRKGDIASKQEEELEQKIREWPRSAETDPYQAGLELLAENLRILLNDSILKTAYNEFCEPSIEQAVKDLVGEGIKEVILITTMLTPGGSHSEKEIPAEVTKLRTKYPNVEITYAWPFDLTKVAEMMNAQILMVQAEKTGT